MKRISIRAHAESPVAPGTRSAYGHFMESHGYIPGGAWRGSVAGEILKNCPKSNELPGGDCTCECQLQHEGKCYFPAVFLDDPGVIFTSLYPTVSDELTILPTPLSLHTCKHSGGSKSQQEYLRRRKVKDATTLRAQAAPDEHGVVDLLGKQSPGCCSVCSADLTGVQEPFFFYQNQTTPECLRLLRSEGTVQTRVALNRHRHTAEDRMLYSINALQRTNGHNENDGDVGFAGFLLLPELPSDVEKKLAKLVRSRLMVGGGVSRGLGALQLQWRNETALLQDDMPERLQKCQPKQGCTRFVLLLTDDAVLLDCKTQAPVAGLTEEVVNSRLQYLAGSEALPNITLIRGAACHRTTVISGWNAAWDLPKQSVLATVKGSCALFEAPVSMEKSEFDTLVKALSRLECEGIGERRNEGLGQVVVCHPVHQGGFKDGQ